MGTEFIAQGDSNTDIVSGNPTAVGTLVEKLGSSDRATREHARIALVSIGAPAVEALATALAGGSTRVRWEAAKCLRRINDPAGAAALVAALEDTHSGVRWIAADALSCLGRFGLAPLLRALMSRSDSPWLRSGAHHVLNALPGAEMQEKIRPVLAALNDIEPDLEVPVAAHEALIALAASA